MKKLFLFAALIILVSCKKEISTIVYPPGTHFTVNGNSTDAKQTGAQIIADTNSYWIARNIKPDTVIVPTNPYTVIKSCGCFGTIPGYYAQSANHLNYEVSEADITVIK